MLLRRGSGWVEGAAPGREPRALQFEFDLAEQGNDADALPMPRPRGCRAPRWSTTASTSVRDPNGRSISRHAPLRVPVACVRVAERQSKNPTLDRVPRGTWVSSSTLRMPDSGTTTERGTMTAPSVPATRSAACCGWGWSVTKPSPGRGSREARKNCSPSASVTRTSGCGRSWVAANSSISATSVRAQVSSAVSGSDGIRGPPSGPARSVMRRGCGRARRRRRRCGRSGGRVRLPRPARGTRAPARR